LKARDEEFEGDKRFVVFGTGCISAIMWAISAYKTTPSINFSAGISSLISSLLGYFFDIGWYEYFGRFGGWIVGFRRRIREGSSTVFPGIREAPSAIYLRIFPRE
jgi:hypothetical protein